MKYLKYFYDVGKDSILKEHMELEDRNFIKSIFQDIIDDYDIYLGELGAGGSGIFYNINPFVTKYNKSGAPIKPTYYFRVTFWSEHGSVFQQSDIIENLDLGPYIKRLEFAGYTIENRTRIWDKDSDKSRCGQLSNKTPKWGDIKQIILDIYPS